MAPISSQQKSDPNSSYTCTSCGKVCVNWRAYVYHQRSRHSESDGRRFACNLCGRQFYTRHRLKKHTLGHEKGKHHCCQMCGKLFESSKKLTIHSLVHNLSSLHDQNLQCIDCGRKYTDWIPFKQHMKTHGAEGVCYPCEVCEEAFPTQYELEKHKRVHKQFQCEFCDRFFRSASVLSVHLRVHTGERPYKCGLCERDFSQPCVLKVHMRTHAKDGRFECKLCSLAFLDVMEYFRHHMAHLEEGNLQCEECGKMFDNINNKNRHMASHRERDGRQCHVCGKEFGRVSHLEAHMLSHSDSDPIPLTCKVCGKTFSSQDLLTVHYSSHMTGDLSSSDAALSAPDGVPLFCGICGKMFKDREYLHKHMSKHDKEAQKSMKFETFIDEDVIKVENGQFACADCGKTFGKADHLVVHQREHTGECPHSCCMCGQSFMLRAQLLQHIREHRQNGAMMYLNLDAGEVCATMSDIKDVLKLTNADDSDSGTETDMYRHEERMKSKLASGHSELQQEDQSVESQIVQNELQQAKTDVIQHRIPHKKQAPQFQQQLQRLDHHQIDNHIASPTLDHSSLGFVSSSVSSSNDATGTSLANHQIASTFHEKRDQMPPPHVSRPSCPDTMSSTSCVPESHSITHAHYAHSNIDNIISSKGENYLYNNNNVTTNNNSHNLSNPLIYNDLISRGIQVPINDNNNSQHLKPESRMPVAMHMSAGHQTLKTNSTHQDILLSFPRVHMASTSISNVPLHHHLSLPSNVDGQSTTRLNPDIYHTLTNFQLLPQTAFPENSHHM